MLAISRAVDAHVVGVVFDIAPLLRVESTAEVRLTVVSYYINTISEVFNQPFVSELLTPTPDILSRIVDWSLLSHFFGRTRFVLLQVL
ncbi:hypothetical protein C461_04312 [Halorubrum aidingense JCM 13560]|uniref:Uncharacterized protein n=1 Tax=Halorubrum aidingense JCM 13560 TaxID=1230454 RepID=M0PFY8_9EURY|nr:hypothetical protein C461_04312 [Halorubrum aidingense JCM 13560]